MALHLLGKWGDAWRDELQSPHLAPPTVSLIEQVVVNTRLSVAEKREVARELVAHFEDGITVGLTTSELIAEFGDPQLAAQLIRRGKLRNRTMSNKLLRGSIWGSVGLVIGYVLLLWYFNRGVPRPTTDYIAELNRDISQVAQENRAWPIYRDVFARMKFVEGPGSNFEELHYRLPESNDYLRLVLPSDGEQWDRAIQKLKQSQELLDTLRAARYKTHFGLELQVDRSKYAPEDFAALFSRAWAVPTATEPTTPDSSNAITPQSLLDNSMSSILLPHIQTMRNAARILTVDLRWAMTTQDWERAVQNVEALYGIARQVNEPKFLVATLVGCAISNIACDAVDELLNLGANELSADQFERLQQAIDRDDVWDFVSFDAERLFFDDLLQRVYTDDGSGDGRITPIGLQVIEYFRTQSAYGQMRSDFDLVTKSQAIWEKVTSPVSLLTMPSRREYRDAADKFYDDVEEQFFRPWHEDTLSELESSIDDRFAFFKLTIPSFIQIRSAVARTAMNRNTTSAAVAIHRFRRDHGDWPAQIDQLLGDYLKQWPIDPITNQPFEYRARDQEFVIYGFGVDKDDDGGRAIQVDYTGAYKKPERATNNDSSKSADKTVLRPQTASEFTLTTDPSADGDWIAWPRHAGRKE